MSLIHYGTGHVAGVEVMKEAMWRVDTSDRMSFRDPRLRNGTVAGQLSLFDEAAITDPELAMPPQVRHHWASSAAARFRAHAAVPGRAGHRAAAPSWTGRCCRQHRQPPTSCAGCGRRSRPETARLNVSRVAKALEGFPDDAALGDETARTRQAVA